MSNDVRCEVPFRAGKGQVLCYHQASFRTKGTYAGAQEGVGKGPLLLGKQPEVQRAPPALALSGHEPVYLSLGFIICEPGNLEFYACLPVAPVRSSAAAAAKPPQKYACSLQRKWTT